MRAPRPYGYSAVDAGAQFEGEGDVLAVRPVVSGEVGDGPGDAEDPVDTAGGEESAFDVAFGGGEGSGCGEVAGAQFVAGDLAVDVPGGVGEACGGAVAGLVDARGDGGGGLAPVALAEEVGTGDGFDFHAQVDAVEEGSGQACLVAADECGRAFAAGAVQGVPSAGAGVGREGEEEAGGEAYDPGGTGDDDVSGFEGLTEGVEGLAGELGGLVEKQDPAVRQGDGAWPGQAVSATDEGLHGGRVVRRAVGGSADEGFAGREDAGDGVDGGDFE